MYSLFAYSLKNRDFFLTPNVNCVLNIFGINLLLVLHHFRLTVLHLQVKHWTSPLLTHYVYVALSHVWVCGCKCVNSHRESCCSRLGEGIFTEGGRAIKYYWLAAGGSRNIIHFFKGGINIYLIIFFLFSLMDLRNS